MKPSRLMLAVLGSVAGALILTYLVFDYYTRESADDLMNAVIRSEAASIQQGNILNSVTKLQSVVETSESLRGLAVYDRSLETRFAFPLIVLGETPQIAADFHGDFKRAGLFDKIFVRPLGQQKSAVFYFRPRFVFWTYILFSAVLILFSVLLAYLGRRIEWVRGQERAQVFFSISEQISHDVKSPLSALSLLGGVLQRQGGPHEILLQAVKRIEDIVNDLKSQSHTLSARYTSNSRFRVDECVEQVLAEKRIQFPERTLKVEGKLELVSRGPSDQFARVISNLLNNALEASPENAPVNVSFESSGNSATITIEDRGKGIAQEDLGRLFQRGFTKGKSGGSGLGLFHARQVLQAMGGKISIDSKVGQGTRVKLGLRLSAESDRQFAPG